MTEPVIATVGMSATVCDYDNVTMAAVVAVTINKTVTVIVTVTVTISVTE